MKPKETYKVLLIGSGFSANELNNYPYKENGWTIIAINHGWMATDEWTYMVHSTDFRGTKPTPRSDQLMTSAYGEAVKQFGGHQVCGYSVTLCTSYWVLVNLKPKYMGYLGCDMNYTPNEKGDTHIYGLGLDFKKNKISDPDRMIKQHGKGDPAFLSTIYMRFAEKAIDFNDTKVYNFSSDPDTRLPYTKIKPADLDRSI